jgi:formate hydrogenlyase subunit 6/NADH:ubiquinone oxidoreductase subunit I
VTPRADTALSRRRLLGLARALADGPTVGAGCLARRGVFCEACRDACTARALRFERRPGAAPLPAIDPELCTLCGECAGSCPVAAIVIPARG